MTHRSVDLEAVARDDQLLDQLGAGLLPDTPDKTVQALYTWRTDLAAGADDVPLSGTTRRANGTATARGVARVNGIRPGRVNGATGLNGAARAGDVTRINGAAADRTGPFPTGPGPQQAQADAEDDNDADPQPRRRGRRRAAVAATVVGLSAGLGGVAVAAADAQPGSPLWPITKVIYAETAADRQAEADAKGALAKARRALHEGRVSDAERHLDVAERRAQEAPPEESDELRDEMDSVRSKINERQGSDDRDADPEPTTSVPTTPTLPEPGDKDKSSGGDRKSDQREGRESPRDDERGRDGGRPSADTTAGLTTPNISVIAEQLPE